MDKWGPICRSLEIFFILTCAGEKGMPYKKIQSGSHNFISFSLGIWFRWWLFYSQLIFNLFLRNFVGFYDKCSHTNYQLNFMVSSYHIFDSFETHCRFASTAVRNKCFSLPPSYPTRGTVVVGPLDVEMLAPQDPKPDWFSYWILLRSLTVTGMLKCC